MAYNKAEEEKKWRTWKAAEEKKLRLLGFSQQDIDILRQFDWEVFNSDRRFFQRALDPGTYLEDAPTPPRKEEADTVEALLDSIENEELYQTLLSMDKLTLLIAVQKMQGYAAREIAQQLHLSPKAVYRRIDRLKEKLKNFFE